MNQHTKPQSISEQADHLEEEMMHELERVVTKSTLHYLAEGQVKIDTSAAAGGTGWLIFELGSSSDRILLTSGALNVGTGLDLDDFALQPSHRHRERSAQCHQPTACRWVISGVRCLPMRTPTTSMRTADQRLA